ncbi:ABC transporter ATP-binding protein [Ohtaekwangia koreensis]|uniref:ATP-binding cassette, subfamily B, MsbA n=1 Tax=Ohtaekwangia koreensis TaxID=688867 RepID=A0A1T5M648_9BACT|nr:ABC transporter ATP-binding protein [Ohtaekwangia koreensis]SKC83308.1 ATP-binding cassette, subfamily B, MsbA [Ohtaekwangia koreensis]
MRIWLRFYGFFKPYQGYGLLLLVLLLIGNLGSLVTPFFLKIIIDKVFGERNYDLLLNIIFTLTAIYILRIIAGFLADYLYTWISNKITVTLTTSLFAHMLKLPIQFFRSQSVGTIVYKINNEVGQVRRAFTGTVISMINNIITIIALIVLMIVLDMKLFLVVSILYPLLLMVMKLFSPSIKRVVEKTRREESDLMAFLTERFSNIKFIKLFNGYRSENQTMDSRISEIVKLNLHSTVLSSASNGLSVFLLALIPLVVLAYGGKLVLQDAMTVGTLIAFLQYANKLHEPLRNVVNLYVDLVKTSVSIKRLFELFDEPPQQNLEGELTMFSKPFNAVEFRNISFAHADKPILQDFNFTFKAGKHYALVGTSGSGKTTLADLMSKIIEPKRGSIFVDGQDLKDIPMMQWMNSYSICSQEYFIINGTLQENFSYGNDNSSIENLTDILQQIRLQDEAGTDLSVRSFGERGSQLSGGQKQKIAIARSAVRHPDLLVLDEATSEIDAASEESIYRFLIDTCKISTLITITHRLSALGFADEIIYLENGRIVEQGSLEDLIARKGYFFELFKNQFNTGNSLSMKNRLSQVVVK